jgi:hypothetical protein
MDDSQRLERRLYGLCLIAAPLLMAASTLSWRDDSLGLRGGVLVVYGFTCWIGVFLALASRLLPRMPRFALTAVPVAILGCVAGTNFGVEGVVEGSLGIADLTKAMLTDANGAEHAAVTLAFFLPGLLFPLMLLVYAAALLRERLLPTWCGVLIALGALTFPISRIPRIQELALLSDTLLLVPLVWLSSRYLRAERAKITPLPK